MTVAMLQTEKLSLSPLLDGTFHITPLGFQIAFVFVPCFSPFRFEESRSNDSHARDHITDYQLLYFFQTTGYIFFWRHMYCGKKKWKIPAHNRYSCVTLSYWQLVGLLAVYSKTNLHPPLSIPDAVFLYRATFNFSSLTPIYHVAYFLSSVH